MALDATNYFDLYNVFVNEVVGDVWLAIVIGLILILFFSIKLKMPYELPVLFSLLFLSMFFAEVTSLLIIWVFILLFVGSMFYFTLSKMTR